MLPKNHFKLFCNVYLRESFKQDIFCKCLRPSSLTSRTVSLSHSGIFRSNHPATNRKYLCLQLVLPFSIVRSGGKNVSSIMVQFQPLLLNVIIFAKIAKAQHVFSDDLIVSHRGEIMKGRLCWSSWAFIVLKATIVPGTLQAPGDISCSDWSFDEVSPSPPPHPLPLAAMPFSHVCPKIHWKPRMISDGYITSHSQRWYCQYSEYLVKLKQMATTS